MADELQFQDFHSSKVQSVQRQSSDDGDTYHFTHADNARLITDDENQQSTPSSAFWTFEFYAQYFNVDTTNIVDRLVHSVLPRIGSNFVTQHVRPKADLYGPLWIMLTLVFAIALGGNISSYVRSNMHQDWHYDFTIVTASASTIMLYITFLPLIIYTVERYRHARVTYSYVELVDLYAYSLAVFIPVCLLCTIDVSWIRWSLVMFAALLTSLTLAFSLHHAFEGDTRLVAFVVVGVAIFVHFLLAVAFKELFFERGMTLETPMTPAPTVGTNSSISSATAQV